MTPMDSQTTLTISEGYDLPTQQHYTKKKFSCCDCFHRQCTFRLWQILVFLLVIAFIIAVMSLLIAMFGPGNTNLTYSKSESKAENPTGKSHRVTESTSSTKATEGPTRRTTAEGMHASTCQPLETTVTPTTLPSDNRIPIQCDVAIVGGGISGLLTAYELLKNSNETNVCILEKENRLGGKIFDHRFADAPNVTIGLGEWHLYAENDESNLCHDLNLCNDPDYWDTTNVHRVEDRGVFADSFDSLKSGAFPTLLYRTPTDNMTVLKTASFVTNADRGNVSDLPTAGRFLSMLLSPEGAKWMTDAYGLKGGYIEKINPKSYIKHLKVTLQYLDEERDDDFRPKRGMSTLVENLISRVRKLNGTIYRQETVTSVSNEGNNFILLTSNFTVQANKMVLTAGPEALKKIKGNVMQNITNHDIFKSIVSVPAFRGAAVYPTAWWNDSVALLKNNSLQNLQRFISNSNCLGITMPYKSAHNNGTAVLHTIANNGGCSDNWGNILKVSKDAVDKEIKRALEYKFQREIPEPLDTAYKYWEEGFWFFQKPGTNFSLSDLREWAKKPLDGNQNRVFLVGRAFYQFGGLLQDDIRSTAKALKQGWNITLEASSDENI